MTVTNPTREIGLGSYLLVLPRIWARSPLWRVVAAGAVFMLLTCGLQFTTGGHDWEDALGFLNLWVVAAGPAFVAVVVGYLAHIDRTSRSGGVIYRSPARRDLLVGRTLVAFGWSLVVQFAAIGMWLLVSVAGPTGVAVGSAIGSAALIAGASAVSGSWFCVALAFVSTRAPVAGPAIVGLGSIALGVEFAESQRWYLCPPAWMLRSVLGTIGTHVNGTSLDGQSLTSGPIPFVGSVLLALVLLVLLAPLTGVTAPHAISGGGVSGLLMRPFTGAIRRLDGPSGAIVQIARGAVVPGLSVATIAFVALIARWRTSSDVAELFGLLVLPMGCTVLAALWVHRFDAGARGLACRPQRPGALGFRLIAAMDLVVAVIVGGVSAVTASGGLGIGSVVQQGLVFLSVGVMLVGVSTALATTVGVVALISTGIIGTIFGALIGGTNLYPTVGVVVPYAWAAHPTEVNPVVLVPAALLVGAATSVLAARRIYPARRR